MLVPCLLVNSSGATGIADARLDRMEERLRRIEVLIEKMLGAVSIVLNVNACT